jgi:hypothetical protein
MKNIVRFRFRPWEASEHPGERLLALLDHHPTLRAELQRLVAKKAALNGQNHRTGAEEATIP